MLIDDINKIKSIAYDELISSPEVMLLLKVYSELWLNGKNPGWCEKCMRNYYYKVINEGVEQQKKIMELKKRTCVPNWEGIKYIRGAFYNSETITDEIAKDALKHGYLKENNFKKLPESLPEPKEIIEDIISEPQEKKETRGRKKKA